jgi:hypothetical protein
MTSAINEGDRCDVEGEYTWCSQNTTIIPALMKSFLKPSLNVYHDRCLAFNASSSADNSSAMMRTSCANKLPFICELQCSGPTCPAASTCAKNVLHIICMKYLNKITLFTQATLFGTDGKIKGRYSNIQKEISAC